MRQCVVCDHPDRTKIEKRLKDGESDRDVAAYCGLTHSAVYRHHKNHMEHMLKPRISKKERLIPEKTTETPIETPKPPIETPPEPVSIQDNSLNAYEDLIHLKAKAKAMIDETQKGTIFERVTAMKELRETIKALVSVYETQKRLETEYAPKLAQNQTFVHRWLYEHYPQVLLELTEALRNG